MKRSVLVLSFCLLLTGTSFANKEFSVPYPPFSPGLFPCMSCHSGLDRNKKHRPLTEMHQDIKIVNHGDRWCYDCHNETDMNTLRLANGTKVKFEESYKLCGQCHGNILKDWKNGVHGKRTGSWNGEKQYLLCVHCHNPHNPKFKSLTPEAPPMRPTPLGGGSRHESHGDPKTGTTADTKSEQKTH